MQVSQQRSGTKKSSRHSRDSPELKERYNDNHNQLLATKFGDLTQRGLQMTGSKELEKKKSKNQGDNTQYIRNLYKKYLGKQNSNNSERKIKTDMKDAKTEKTLITQSCRQKLNYEGENITTTKGNVLAESTAFMQKKNNFLKKSTELQKNIKQPSYNFYDQMKDQEGLHFIGDNNNTLVRALKIINGVRKNCK